jgi:signal transduction histidine kinase
VSSHPLLTVEIRYEQDVVLARRRARQTAQALGLETQDQIRLATAVSEIARNAYQYAGGGSVAFELRDAPARAIVARVVDRGPGILALASVLEGRYSSRTGMGLGIVGARRLVDEFDLRTAPGQGTSVLLVKHLDHRSPPVTHALAADVTRRLTERTGDDPLAEIQAQNQELLRTLHELRVHQAEVERLNRELAETNRGVVALYAELDERADELGRASELKSRFLSNISHELRTPLNSILNVARLLTDRMDGPLTAEQARQVGLIRGAAESLLAIVNDLLDIARIEAGKTVVRPTEFTVADLFAALRGMFRPLVTADAVELVFGEVDGLPTMVSDEGKLSQILRNLVANAIKFTERGVVRVTVEPADADALAFHVADTGIGIPAEAHERVFEEFAQLEGPLQRIAGGTGLGLPLSRRLAVLLGGTLTLQSTPGLGSTFTLRVPVRWTAGEPGLPGAASEVQHV